MRGFSLDLCEVNMKRRIRFFKSGAMLTAVALTMRSVGLLFGAFVSHTVGAEGVGLYTVVMTVYSFAATLASSGISLTVTRLVASAIGEKREEDVAPILRSAIKYSLVFGVLSGFLLFSLADIIGTGILSESRAIISLRILSFSLIPVALCSVFTGYFSGVKRVGFNAATQIFSQFLKISVTVYLVSVASEWGMTASVAALSASITVTEIFGFLLLWLEYLYDRHKHGTRAKKNVPSMWKKVSSSALPLAVSAYVRSVLTTIEHILIPKRLISRGEENSEAYSNYGTLHGMALPIILYPITPLTSFSGLLVPEFAETLAAGDRARMNRIATEAINATLTYSVLAATFLYFFSEELGYIIYDSYGAGYYIAMLAPIVPVMYLDHVTDGILKGVGEQVYSMWVNITDSFLSVLLVYFLIPTLGISGYALVIIIMEGYNFLLSAIRLRRHVKIRPDVISSLLLPLLSATLALSITNGVFIIGSGDVGGAFLAMKIIFAAALFIAFLLLMRIAFSKIFARPCTKRFFEKSNGDPIAISKLEERAISGNVGKYK